MSRDTARRIAGFYVFILVFTAFPAAQQRDVAGETTRLIEKLKVGPCNPGAMNASLLRTLTPGGRFAVVDFSPRNGSSDPVAPADRASGSSHGLVTPCRCAGPTGVQEVRRSGT